MELAVNLDDKSKQRFYTSLKDLMQDAGKKTEKEFADALVNAINSAFSAAGKASPFNVTDIINVDGLGKKIAEQMMSGIKQGLSGVTKDVSSTIKTLTAQIDELTLKRQKGSKQHKQIKNYPYLSEMSYKSKEFKHLKLDDNIEAQATKIMTGFYEAQEALDGLQRGSKEYNAALISAFDKAKQAIQMGKTLHDKGIKLQNDDTADFFDDPKDMMAGLIENRKHLEDLETYIKKLEDYISKTLPQKISLLGTQLNELKAQSGDIINQDGLKSSLKTIEEITAAYQRMVKLSPKKQEKYENNLIEAINYKAPEGQFSVKAIADKYKESVENGDDWEIQYQWLIKFTRAYDAYSQKKFADDRVQKGILEAYRPLYDEVASQAQNAQNMLQNILNIKTNTPLVGMEAEVNSNREKAQVVETVVKAEKEQVEVEKANNAQINEKTNLIKQEIEAQKQLNNVQQKDSNSTTGSIFDKYPNMFGAVKDKQKLNENSADVANKEISTQKAITTELEKQNKLLLYRVGKTSWNPDKFRNSDMMGNAIQFGNKMSDDGEYHGSLIDDYGGFGDGLFASTIGSAKSLAGNSLPDDQSYFEIDASKYNLHINRTVEQANKVKDFLLKLQKFILAAGDFRGFDDELTGVTDETLFTEAQSIFKSFNMSKQETLEWLNSMKQLVKKNGLDANGIWTKADDKFLNSHNFGTRFMKTMGYEGVVNNTGDEEIDGYGDGTVIYDPDFKALNKYMQDTGHVWKSNQEYLTYLDAVKQKVQEGTNAYIESKKAIDSNTTAKNNNTNATKSETSITQQATEAQQEFNQAKTKETKPQSKPVSAPVPLSEQKSEQHAVGGTSIDDGKLKGILEAITYNVKVVQDSDANSDNSLSIDEASLESVLNKVLGNITQQENQPWAREDTLNTTIKGVLDKIQANTQKTKKQPIGTRSTLATEETLQNILKAINSKTTTSSENAKTGTQGTSKTKTDLPSVGPAPFTEKLKSRVGDLAKLKTQLVATGKLTDDIDNQIEELLISLEQVKNGPDLTVWSEKFKQLKTKVDIGNIWDNIDKKSFKEQIQEQRKLNNIDIANSTSNSGRKALNSLWKIDDTVDVESINDVKKLRSELTKLAAAKKIVDDKIREGQDLSKQDINNLQMSSDGVAKYTTKIKELIANYERLKNGEVIGDYIAGSNSDEAQLQSAINTRFDGKAKIKRYERNSYGDLTAIAEVKSGARAFTEYSVAVSQADGKIKALKGTTHQMPSWLDSVKKKLREISQYFSAMSVINRAMQELRKGIQYVKEIDLALTELKKVTDETEETYDKFLDTASKTAAKVGSTIKEVISSTSDWARLGYSMEQAAKFAETTQILMNVSEFTDVSQATDTLISAVQAFGYTAETSMDVVDLLNTIGNNYAISTADLAQSLTKSSASLVAAGGNLAEAAALTATANAIVQDADSVGTALKTTSLRLRGTSVEILEEEGVDSDGAVTSKSKLRSKVQALSGVDILTETGDYKSTYEILSQIADVWGTINDMDQAALLELLAGKRNASVLAAILQAPEQLKAAYEDANNAQGSALKENEKYMDSIQGKIDQFTNAIQTLWKNTLDDDVVKLFVEIGTGLVNILDKLGPINVLVASIMTYLSKKYHILDFDSIATSLQKVADISKGQGIKGFWKNLKSGFKDGSISIDSLRNTVSRLKDEFKDLEGSTSGKDVRKRTSINGRIKEYQAEIDAYDKMIADRDAAFKKRDDAKLELDNVQAKLENAQPMAGPGGAQIYTSNLEKLQKEVDDAKKKFQQADTEAKNLDKTVKKSGKSGVGVFKSLGKSVNKFTQQLVKAAAQMIIMWAISKLISLITDALDKWINAGEIATEKFDELTNQLKETKNEIEGINNELKTLDDKIAELTAKGKLSFTEQEELERLEAERKELERELALKEELAKQQQAQVNSQTSGQVEYYKSKGVESGKTTGQRALSGAGTGAAVGAAAGAAIGSFIPVLGTAIGALIGAVGGAIVGAAAGGIAGATETKVGDRIDNFEEELAAKEKAVEDARQAYYDDLGNETKKKAYEDAQKDLTDLKGDMSTYFSELGAYYDNLDLSIYDPEKDAETIERLKKERDDFYNTQDKYLIESGSEGATSNAIVRVFDKKENKKAKEDIESLMAQLKEDPGNTAIEQKIKDIINGSETLTADFTAIGIEIDDVARSFTQMAEDQAFGTIDGKVKELERATTVFNNLLNGGKFNFEGQSIGLADLFTDEGEVVQTKLSEIFKGTSAETREAITGLLERSYDDIQDGTVNIETLLGEFASRGSEAILKILEETSDTFEEISENMDKIQGSYSTLSNAVEQYNSAGFLTLDNLQSLLSLEPEYLALLQMENGQLTINREGYIALVQTKLAEAKASVVQSAMKQLNALAAKKEADATNEASTAAANSISNLGTYADALSGVAKNAIGAAGAVYAFNNAVAGAQANELVKQEEIDAIINSMDTQLQMIDSVGANLSTNFGSIMTGGEGGNPKDGGEDSDMFEELLKKHQAELDAIAHEKDLIQAEIDEAEAKGFIASEQYYNKLIALEQKDITQLKAKQQALKDYYAQYSESMSTDEIDKWNAEMRATVLAIKEADKNMIEFGNTIREIGEEYFNKVSEDIDAINEEIEFMHGLLEDEPVADENGNWSNEALTRLGLYTQQMEKAAFETQRAKDELAELQATTSEADKNTDWYREREEELTQTIYDNANAYNDYKDGIVELNEARIEAIKEGIEKEIEAYNDLLDVKREELDAERDLYDFKKNIEEQNKSIADTERKLAALSGSTAAEDIAERKRLEAELRKQQGDLDDTYYDHSMTAQQNALDEEGRYFEEAQQRRIESLEAMLENTEELIVNSMMDVMLNADTVHNTLNEQANIYGVTLSEELTKPWLNASAQAVAWRDELKRDMTEGEWAAMIGEGGAITAFSNGVATKLGGSWDTAKTKVKAYSDFLTGTELKNNLSGAVTTFTTYLQKIVDKWNEIRNAAVAATSVTPTVPSGGTSGGSGGNPTPSPSPTPAPKKEEPKVKLRGLMQTSREMILGSKSFVDANTETINGVKYYRDSKTGYYYKISDLNSNRKYDGGRTTGWAIPKGTWFYTKHAKGTLGIKHDEWALTDELGPELTMYATPEGTLSFMRAGSTVIPAELTKELMDIGAVGLNGLMKPKFDSGLNVINNAINKPEYNFNIEALVKADHIDQNSIKDVEKMVNKQLDEFTRKLNYSLKVVGGK